MGDQYILVDKIKIQELAKALYDCILKFKETRELNGTEVIAAMFEAIYIVARLEVTAKKEA